MTRLLPLAFVLLCAPNALVAARPATPTTADADLALVRERFVRSVLPVGAAAVDQVNALGRNYAASLQANGSWSDINYADATRSVWAASDHLKRLLVMAEAARLARNAGRPDPALEAKILLALNWWTDHDYRNPNWWWNQIGVPELTGEVATLLGPQLPYGERARVVAILLRANWDKVGANLTWAAGIQIVRGCLQNDPAPVAEAYQRMYREIEIVSQPQDGIQQDDSFHQHGTQLYNGGYGLDFANDVGRFVSYAWGTRFQIPVARMAIFSAYLLNGEQWMIRGNVFDYSADGREITRPGKVVVPRNNDAGGPVTPVGPAYSLGNVLALLAAEPTPRKKELENFAARLQGKPNAPPFTGNKQFWCSDFMTHRRPAYYTSVKMLSNRMQNGELVNSEGKKSVHLSDGTNYLYLTGDEYKDIFPVWDWTKIPGTTAIQGTLDTGESDPIRARGTTTFDGGVSDGTYGIAAMDLARGNLVAKKSWFFFDSSYVALGAGIKLTGDTEHAVATDVNQPLLMSNVLTSETKGPMATGTRTFDAAHRVWIYHNHVGYIFPPHTKVYLSVGPQTGAWSEIGTGPSALITKRVFDLWIDHGVAPRDASYEYIVVPAATETEVAKLSAHPDVLVLANTANTQAVYNRTLKLAEIAFRDAGSLSTPLGKVEADHSCLLLVRQTAAGWRVTASNPENQPLTLHVTVKGKQTTIELPSETLAGSSVSVDVR